VTIRNCFYHVGFVETEEEEEEGDDRSIEAQESLTDKTYENWIDIDRDLQTSEEYFQICQSIVSEATSNNEEEIDESDEEEADVVVKPPSNKAVLKTLEVMRRAVYHRGTNFNMQYEYKQYINGIVKSDKTQTKITNFLINNM